MMWRYFCANEPAAQECCSASLEVDISIPVARHQLAHLASPLSLVTSRRSRDAEDSEDGGEGSPLGRKKSSSVEGALLYAVV
ncbi:hypothetical protein CEXT_295051 [Caerostris extrusa]|uniref:Uncharacterized protein n=1 Tax=Caerostris extrusa TaxID=172846 RepID=A0AAV4RU43_CAEEX|nr:hypothetical protein CEXT_295051 [Caerostris extrusa]